MHFDRITSEYFVCTLAFDELEYVVRTNGRGEWMALVYDGFCGEDTVLKTGLSSRWAAVKVCREDYLGVMAARR